MKFSLILLVSALSFSASAGFPPEIQTIQDGLKLKKIEKNCDIILTEWSDDLDELNLRPVQKEHAHKEDLQALFHLRLSLHEQIQGMSVECKKITQGIFSRLREYEDAVGIMVYDQLKIAQIDYNKVKAPVLEHADYAPYKLNPKFSEFQFEEGDILITKGISPISSTITTFTDHHSPFSHIAFVHINPKSNRPETIESYVGKGVSFFTIEAAMKNENSRVLVLRPKDRELAKNAALYMRERVSSTFSKGSYIPYDYQMDFNNNHTLSCEEVAFDSYKTASRGTFVIPEAPSLIKFNREDLTNRMGMKKGKMMMPADMEVDSRFDIVLDWTDYRIIRDSWRKDTMMRVALEAYESGSYELPENYATRLVPYIWSLRNVPYVWPLAAKVSGIPEDFTPDVPPLSIATMVSFKLIEAQHLPSLQEYDEAEFKRLGHWPNRTALINKMKAINLIYQKRQNTSKR